MEGEDLLKAKMKTNGKMFDVIFLLILPLLCDLARHFWFELDRYLMVNAFFSVFRFM